MQYYLMRLENENDNKSNFESELWLEALDRIKIDESQPDHVILFPHGISDMETGDEDSEG